MLSRSQEAVQITIIYSSIVTYENTLRPDEDYVLILTSLVFFVAFYGVNYGYLRDNNIASYLRDNHIAW